MTRKITHNEYICAWMADRPSEKDKEIIRAYESQTKAKPDKVHKTNKNTDIKW